MPSTPIYRIIHITNLENIVKSRKLVSPNHDDKDVNYRNIGNNSIIATRSEKPLPINAERTFKDYIAFYFGARSIMLYNIHTGFSEVEQIDQEEIIYLKSTIKQIQANQLDFFFTDGHALQYPTTRFFTNIEDIKNVNIKDANARIFSASAENQNPGLKRRKQAEFHVYHELDWNLIDEIIVKSEQASNIVKEILERNNSSKTITINSRFYF